MSPPTPAAATAAPSAAAATLRSWQLDIQGMSCGACATRLERQLAKVHAGLAAMDRILADKPYCCGIYFTLADVATGCALDWLAFRFPQIDWRAAHPALARLADKLAQRPSFADTRPC